MPGKASLHNVNHARMALARLIAEEKLASLALPRLATVVGGLDRAKVRPLIEKHLERLDIFVIIYTTYRKGLRADEKLAHCTRSGGLQMSATIMKDLPLSKVYQLLEPGPVVLLTTAHKGRANVMTMSWHMMVDFEPPLVACVVSNRDHSFGALRATKECVIAIPAVELAPVVVEIGNCSGRDVDKFEAFHLTPMKTERAGPPLVAECFANLKCKVVDTRLVNRYNFFVLEVLKGWIDSTKKNPKTIHHQGLGSFVVDGETIKLKSKMP